MKRLRLAPRIILQKPHYQETYDDSITTNHNERFRPPRYCHWRRYVALKSRKNIFDILIALGITGLITCQGLKKVRRLR
jgi:hypothetical protein